MNAKTNRSEEQIKASQLETLLTSRGWKVLCDLMESRKDQLQRVINKIDPARSQLIFSAKDLDCAKRDIIEIMIKSPKDFITMLQAKKRQEVNEENSLEELL